MFAMTVLCVSSYQVTPAGGFVCPIAMWGSSRTCEASARCAREMAGGKEGGLPELCCSFESFKNRFRYSTRHYLIIMANRT